MRTALAILLTVIISFISNADQMEISIIPSPQKVQEKDFTFVISDNTLIVLGEGSGEAEKLAAGLVSEEIKERYGKSLPITSNEGKTGRNFIFIGLIDKSSVAHEKSRGKFLPAMEGEGYILEVEKDGIYIIAKTPRGVYYGCISLLQLINQNQDQILVPGVLIQDYPDFKFRGISDDISRGQVSTLENFKDIIRRLARYKQNVYMPYLEDMFRFDSHPLIGKNRGALTKEEIKELDAFARKHHVEIIPIFQTLGHMENLLQLPEYMPLAEFPGAACLNIADERIYDFLQELFDEIVPMFSSKYFHIAADESWDVGRGATRELIEKTSIAEVHAKHFLKVYEMLKAMGKGVIMYGDIVTGLGEVIPGYPEILEKLPDDLIMVYWDYWPLMNYDKKAKIFREAQRPFMVSPAVWNWHRIFPDYLTAVVNIKNMAQTGMRNGAVGFINSSWGDFGGESFRELNWYGFAYGAECSWSPGDVNTEDFNRRFMKDYYGTTDHRLLTIYAMFSNLGNKYINDDLWRPPFMPPAGNETWDLSPQFIVTFKQVKNELSIVRKLLTDLYNEDVIAKNKDHLNYLNFSLRKGELIVQKIETALYLKNFAENAGKKNIGTDELQKVIVKCNDMIESIKKLKDDFVDLWLRTNKEANLHRLLEYYYDRQIAYWLEKINQLEDEIYWVNPHSPSKFIYHPDANPYISRQHQEKHAFFRYTFSIDDLDKIENAMAQTVGDTNLDIYVNGYHIGSMTAKRTLSLIVEKKRVKFWNIKEYLIDGQNVIAIEAKNYNRAGSAGMNWYAEMVERDGIRKIVSDETWRVHNKRIDGWTTRQFDDSKWVNAKIVDQRVPLIDRPSFKLNRKSWIIDRVWVATLED